MYVPMSSAGTVSEELELPPQPHKARAHRPRIEADVNLTLRLRPSLAADSSLSEACAQRGTPTPLVRKRETQQPRSRGQDERLGAPLATTRAGELPADRGAGAGCARGPHQRQAVASRSSDGVECAIPHYYVPQKETQHGAWVLRLWWMSALVVFEAVEASHVALRLSHRPERSREFVRTLLS